MTTLSYIRLVSETSHVDSGARRERTTAQARRNGGYCQIRSVRHVVAVPHA